MKFISQRGTFYGVDLCKAYPPNFKTGVYVIVSTDSFSTDLKQVGCIKEAFSVDHTKNDNISLILCQVVAVKKYYPVLPAVPKNSSERRKTVLRAAQ